MKITTNTNTTNTTTNTTNTTTANLDNIINDNNIIRMANAITIKALQTNFAKSGNEYIRKLLNNAITFSLDNSKGIEGDGCDLIQDTALYLMQYKGCTLDQPTNDGQTDKDGNPISIKRGAYRNIHNIITKIKRKEYKQVYLSDYENENGEIAVPFLWDMPIPFRLTLAFGHRKWYNFTKSTLGQ